MLPSTPMQATRQVHLFFYVSSRAALGQLKEPYRTLIILKVSIGGSDPTSKGSFTASLRNQTRRIVAHVDLAFVRCRVAHGAEALWRCDVMCPTLSSRQSSPKRRGEMASTPCCLGLNLREQQAQEHKRYRSVKAKSPQRCLPRQEASEPCGEQPHDQQPTSSLFGVDAPQVTEDPN